MAKQITSTAEHAFQTVPITFEFVYDLDQVREDFLDLYVRGLILKKIRVLLTQLGRFDILSHFFAKMD